MPVAHDAAFVHLHDAVGEVDDVVAGGGGDDAAAERTARGGEEFEEGDQVAILREGIEIFHKKRLRAGDEGAGQGHSLLRPEGERFDGEIGGVRHADMVEHATGFFAGLLRGGFGEFEEGHGDVFHHIERGKQEGCLENEAEVAAAGVDAPVFGPLAGGFALEQDVAGVGGFEESQEPQQQVAPGVGAAEEQMERGGFEGESHIVELLRGRAERAGAGDVAGG